MYKMFEFGMGIIMMFCPAESIDAEVSLDYYENSNGYVYEIETENGTETYETISEFYKELKNVLK